MSRPPSAEPPGTPDPPDTRQTTPPTESYRHPEFDPGRGNPQTGTRRSREVRDLGAEPSPSDQALAGPEAVVPVAVGPGPIPANTGLLTAPTGAEQRALLSVTTKSQIETRGDLRGGDINTTQRSPDEPISTPRLRRDDLRVARLEERLEEQIALLDARLRLLHKGTQRMERLTAFALVLSTLAVAFALFW